MRRLLCAAVASVTFAVAAYALPAALVVVSAKEVRPDEAAGLYYLGSCGAGYLYNCSSAAAARVAPYRVLDRDAQTKEYYIVWAPAWVKVAPEDFAHLGTAVRLSEYEILVSLERGLGPGALRAVDHRIELIRLEPVTPVDWRFDGEAPPAKKDPRIEAAINTITAEEYAGYIKRLQGFRTRAADTNGNGAAAAYIGSFFAAQRLDTSAFVYKSIGLRKAFYPEDADTFFLGSSYDTIKRTKNGGVNWDTIVVDGTNYIGSMFWLNTSTGFVAGYNTVVAKTTDAGDNWEQITFAPNSPPDRYEPLAVFFADGDNGWIGGLAHKAGDDYEGFILKTSDGGYSWEPQLVPRDSRIVAMDFADVFNGWAASSAYVENIYYTDDGGAIWRQGTLPGASRFVDLAAVTPTTAWAADRLGRLLKTSDGLNWDYALTGIEGYYYNVDFPDALNGFAAGSKLIKTSDGGATWLEVMNAPEITYDLLDFADRNNGVMGDAAGDHLYLTGDGGVTFREILGDIDLNITNVVGERRGNRVPEEIVIIGGHFDSASDRYPSLCPGADDNASGAAAAMAAARALKDLPFDRTIRVVAFDAEEKGLSGSKAYAEYCSQRGEKIVAFLNADMVSYDEEYGKRDDYAIAFDRYDWLFAYIEGVGGLYGNNLIYENGTCGSDQYSFWRVGYPAIGAIEGSFGPGGHQSYPYYHTTEDTFDKLHPALGVRFVRDYAAMLAHLAGFDDAGVEEPAAESAAVPFSRPFAVYPNPFCYATCTRGVNFVGVKSPATVEIYDLAGRRVAREEVAAGCDECVWRLATSEGETLAPGVYLYRVEGREQKKAGKIVIAK